MTAPTVSIGRRFGDRVEINGEAANADDLRALALLNYGHFTSMQVEDRAVRGLDLHLARLAAGTRELFGTTLDAGRVRGLMRHAVADAPTCSLRVTVYSRALKRERLAEPAEPDVLISVGAPRAGVASPRRLKTFRHERTLPHVKHVGTFALFHFRREAELAGFDDALFVGADGAVSEASVWNIGFFDGVSIVWPDAPKLAGVSMQLLANGLRERGIAATTRKVPLADIGMYRAAFLTNSSCAVQPVAMIDDVAFDADRALAGLLEACYAANAPQAI